jgi:phosphoglycerate dehydrogenase-like enzyme
MLDAAAIARLPRGAILVNVGRGGVVDEPALVEALRDGRLAGAALDVFATEPLPADSPLWGLPNVLISPHTAALSLHEDERIVDLFCENVRRYLRGDDLLNRVDPDLFY